VLSQETESWSGIHLNGILRAEHRKYEVATTLYGGSGTQKWMLAQKQSDSGTESGSMVDYQDFHSTKGWFSNQIYVGDRSEVCVELKMKDDPMTLI
jgi:hypothetical protein